MSQSLLRRKVAIVGCGPVGMLGSLLCQHLGIDYVAFQKYGSPRSHPSAHWLSSNSKSILSQIPSLTTSINAHQQPWQYFRSYRYLQSLFGHQLAITDHFQPTIQQKLKKSVQMFGELPSHIPQNVLLEIMYQGVRDKGNLRFGVDVGRVGVKDGKDGKDNENRREYVLYDQANNPVAQVENVILCSGVNTNLRNNLPPHLPPFHLQGQKNLMNIINIHFTSKKLSQKLTKSSRNAMLHFIYGKKIIAILVNHSIQNTGTFVLQIPNFQPFVDLMEIYSARDLIGMVLEDGEGKEGGGGIGGIGGMGGVGDVEVVHVGKWKLQGVLADSMYKDGIFLAGDAAHAYPPAGGFGMNSGFQDIHELTHKIFLAQKNKNIDCNKIYTEYSSNRRKVNAQYLKKAMQNYEITKNISVSLGYSPNILDYFSKSVLMGAVLAMFSGEKSRILEPIRLKAMSLMYRRQLLKSPGLDLFFDQFDTSIQNISKIRSTIFTQTKKSAQNSPNIYACQGEISKQKIIQLVGNISQKNIHFYNRSKPGFEQGQKLIGSDGNVILQ